MRYYIEKFHAHYKLLHSYCVSNYTHWCLKHRESYRLLLIVLNNLYFNCSFLSILSALGSRLSVPDKKVRHLSPKVLCKKLKGHTGETLWCGTFPLCWYLHTMALGAILQRAGGVLCCLNARARLITDYCLNLFGCHWYLYANCTINIF